MKFGIVKVVGLDLAKVKVGNLQSTYIMVVFKQGCKCGSKFVMEHVCSKQCHNNEENDVLFHLLLFYNSQSRYMKM